MSRQGKGVFTMADGHKYTGEWLQGKEEGKGTDQNPVIMEVICPLDGV